MHEQPTGNEEAWKAPAALQPLTDKPHWLVWKLEAVLDKNGKPKLNDDGKPKSTKVPYQPDGKLAKSNDPRTWSDFDTAARAACNYDGVGFALLNSGIVAFDIDDCRDPDTGTVHPWAAALVDAAGSYAEITPSGTGLRILGYGQGAEVHCKRPAQDGVTCELYRQAKRYITVSGSAGQHRRAH
jgi:primase-polymerase (primpol)-like protein